MATTTGRTFTIFVDDASSRPRVKKASANVSSTTGVLAEDREKHTSSSNFNVPAASPQPFATACEKENLHPITSVRLGLDAASRLKQKGSSKSGKDADGKCMGKALATKLWMPKAGKVEKDSPEMKKRRIAPSTSTRSTAKSLSTTPKSMITKGKSAPVKKPAPKVGLSEKVVEMAKVEEREVNDTKEGMANSDEKLKADADEKEGTDLEALNIQAQAEIDSKCYDLTVSPLADVSRAFEQVVAGDVPNAKKSSAQINVGSEDDILVKTSSLTVSSRASSPPPAPLPSVAAISAALEKDRGPSKQFSTPERKEIYAAFTFSSPSPSAKRFAASRGMGSAFAFGDLAFNPGW